MAERQGFEPWDQFPGQLLSRQLQSATLPPLLTKILLSNTKLLSKYTQNKERCCVAAILHASTHLSLNSLYSFFFSLPLKKLTKNP